MCFVMFKHIGHVLMELNVSESKLILQIPVEMVNTRQQRVNNAMMVIK